MIKALIFDFDGLILDTELPEYQAWQAVFESFGCMLPLAEWAAEIGTIGVFDPSAYLESQLGRPVDRTALHVRHRAHFAELMRGQSILPGVEGYIRDAKARGLRIGIASSSSRGWVAGYLERFGLAASFDCLRCFDDVERVKPAPDLYLAALQALGVRQHEAIALEDSPNGALAAARAGIFCVVVPNPLTRQLPIAADLQLASLADMSLADLLAHVGGARSAGPA